MKLQDIYKKIDDLNETASMNISMSGDTADDVGVLLKMMQNAGLEKAGPVSDISDPNPRMDIEKFRGMVDMPGGDDKGPDDSPCGAPDGPSIGPADGGPSISPPEGPTDDAKGMDIIKLAGLGGDDKADDKEPEEDKDYANEPDEKYGDTQLMTKDLSGGLNGPKKAHPVAAGGDNPMSLRAELTRLEDTIKDDLWKALKEKGAPGAKTAGAPDDISKGFDNMKTTFKGAGKALTKKVGK